jgi:DNA polymerase elongation subunit (family B)
MSYISAWRTGDDVYVWERTPEGRITKKYKGIFEFFTQRHDGTYTSIYDEPLIKHQFNTYKEMYDSKQFYATGYVPMYESDIAPEIKILAKHYFEQPEPALHFTFWDIENDYDPQRGYASIEDPYAPINAIALYHHWKDESVVIAVPSKGWDKNNKLEKLAKETNSRIILVENEKQLLTLFLDQIEDSDVLGGWNSTAFDTPYTAKRVERVLGKSGLQRMSFADARAPKYDTIELYGQEKTIVKLGGRISWDYMDLFKKYDVVERPSYSLDAISNEVLPDLPKLKYSGSLADLYNKDFEYFVRYNIRDTEILKGFEEKLGYAQLANLLYHSGCGQPDSILGTIKLTDLSIINYCHYKLDRKVPDGDPFKQDGTITGAMVLVPKRGLHNHIGSIDVTSLYPSAIRCNNISPETLIGQLDGTLARDDRAVHSGWKIIFDGDPRLTATVVYDSHAKGYQGTETHTGKDWKRILKQRKWSVSGYGTFFNQAQQGVIPAVLTDWFEQRVKYKKLKSQAQKSYDVLSKITDPTDDQLKEMAVQKDKAAYYDRVQNVMKIKLNATYGAMTNLHFRFFDLRLGQSTTGTGRAILEHMCSQVALVLDGKYNMHSESIAYGDSVAGDSVLQTNFGAIAIEDTFLDCQSINGDKQYYFPINLQTLTYDEVTKQQCYRKVVYVMKHKVSKQMYRVWINETTYVDVTQDHSLMGYTKDSASVLVKLTPEQLIDNSVTMLVLQPNGVERTPLYAVEKIDYEGYVYDVEIDDTHTFFANNILVHNTDSCYFKTNADSFTELTRDQQLETSIQIADEVGKQVNASYNDFCELAFCIQPEYRDIIQCAREVVAKRGIFVTKKRYVLKLIDLDGRRCNKLKAMGLEMKKTTTPKIIRTFLEDVVNLILDGEKTWDEIDDFIVGYRKMVRTDLPLVDIGLPKGVKNVELYTEKYKLEGVKARLPGHVAASIHYNECLKHYGDKESAPITSGNKIKVFYLTKKYGKFKSIAIPTDMEQVPQWFTDHFEVKRTLHEEKLIDNNLKIIFNSIERIVPTAQTQFTNSVVDWGDDEDVDDVNVDTENVIEDAENDEVDLY